MAKKKGKKQASAADEVRAFDKLDLKNQGQMLDSLNEELGIRAKITTEAKDQVNVSRQLQSLASDILAKQDSQILGLRKENDIAKDVEKTNRLIQKLKRQANADGEKGNKIAKDQLDIAQKLAKALEKEEKERKKIEDKVGTAGKLMKGLNDIPFLGKIVDTDSALKKMNETAADGGSKFDIIKKGIGSIAGDVKKHMTDPLTIVIALIKAGFQFDSEVTALAKGLGVAREEGKMMRHHFSDLALDLGETAITSADIQKGWGMINNALGTASSAIRDDVAVEAGRMSKLMNMSEESISGFARHAQRSGKDMKQVKLEAIGNVKAMEKEHGTRLDIKKVLEESGKVQGQISAQMGGDPARIASAVAKAQELGMSLEAVASAGKSMLNFEESISAELEAELLTGKQLNLEKARLAALTGDYETLTEEIAENVGDFGDFSKMNVLQQEALAKSVGMTADQLSNQLLKKADLKALAEEAREEGDEETARMLEQRSAQEEFNDVVMQLKQTFVDMAGGPVADFLKGIMKIFTFTVDIFKWFQKIGKAAGNWAKPLGKALDKLGGFGQVLKGIVWLVVAAAAFMAYKSLAWIPVVGAGLGLAASLGVLQMGNTMLNTKKGDDVISPQSGYGKRALMEEGSVTLFNDKDTIVAGTNLTPKKADDNINTPEGSTTIDNSSSGGETQPLQVNVESTMSNDVFARTDKNSETMHMVQTKSDGLFA